LPACTFNKHLIRAKRSLCENAAFSRLVPASGNGGSRTAGGVAVWPADLAFAIVELFLLVCDLQRNPWPVRSGGAAPGE